MGLLDRLLGRSAPPPPDLDALFAVPDAGLTLESAAGLRPSGSGSVAFRAAEGGAFGQVQADVQALLNATNNQSVERAGVERVDDDFGYTWLLARHSPDDLPGLVTNLHAVNAGLQDAGFGPALLCSLVGFADAAGRRLALVYLYKRGTFYPFAPLPGQQRDSALELQVRGLLASDLRIEPDVGRWFPVWGAPGL